MGAARQQKEANVGREQLCFYLETHVADKIRQEAANQERALSSLLRILVRNAVQHPELMLVRPSGPRLDGSGGNS